MNDLICSTIPFFSVDWWDGWSGGFVLDSLQFLTVTIEGARITLKTLDSVASEDLTATCIKQDTNLYKAEPNVDSPCVT